MRAFSEYAAEAFDLDAVDYVLKPVEQDRLAKALAQRQQAAPAEPVSRVAAEAAGKRSYMPVANIAYFEARADYTTAFTLTDSYLVCDSISALERRLAPQGFLRVHRSYLVNIDDVCDVEVLRPSSLIQLKLDRTGASIPVSRRRSTTVKRQLGLA